MYYKNLFGKSLIASVIAQMALSAHSQEVSAGADPDSRSAYNSKLQRVEVRGRPESELEARRRSPIAQQIYGREDLDRFGDTNLTDVLRRLPGVDVQSGAPRLRGLGSGYTQILINGDPAPNGFSFDQLNPAQVERIEISKAPTADQSAQAVAGIINIILKTAPHKRQASARVGGGYNASRPTANASFSYGDRIDAMSFSIPVSGFEWRGESTLLVNRKLTDQDNVFQHSQQIGTQPTWGHAINASPQLNWRLDNEGMVTLQAFLQRTDWKSRVELENIEATSPIFLEDPSMNKGSFENERLTASWRTRLSDTQRVELRLTTGHASEYFNNQTFRVGSPFRHSIGKGTDNTLLQSGKFSQLLGAHHNLSMGWEFEKRRRNDDRDVTVLGQTQLPGIDGLPLDAQVERQVGYIQDEWEVSKQVSIYGGLRYERINTDSATLDNTVSNRSHVLSPLLHVNYKPVVDGRDVVRFSIARTFKAPDLYSLTARPSLNSLYPLANQPNSEIAPDRAGNPSLRPELATGLDLAYESYLSGGGFFSVGVFRREIKDLIRNLNALENVDWATAPRWVVRPQNYSLATSYGLEFELKGRAHELLPLFFTEKNGPVFRWALNVYRSHVNQIPMPDNRLESQQPWSTTLGFDHRFKDLPLSVGFNMAYTPGYRTQQSVTQSLDQSRSRALDFTGQWFVSSQSSLRAAVTNAAPLAANRVIATTSGGILETSRKTNPGYSLAFETKF